MSHAYGSPTPALARIAGAAFERRQQLAACYPWVPAVRFTVGGIPWPAL